MEISIANLKMEEKGTYYENSKHKICIRKERRHQNPGSAALLTSLLRAGSGLLPRARAANKSFPGVKTSQIPTEGKYGTSCNPVLSTLNERGNRRGGGGWLRHHEGK